MGNFGLPEGSYIELRAQTKENALAEADRIWRTFPHDDNATGYAIWRADWGCVHSFRIHENGRQPAEDEVCASAPKTRE